MSIKISIIIPAYNTEKYIAECLQSAISQTLRDIEIIVINDGSTDGTGEIIDSFKAKDPRIITITQENQGLSRSRNNGASIAKGEYLYFMDSDDFISPYSMEILYVNICGKDSNLIYGNKIQFYEKDIEFSSLLKPNQITEHQNLKVSVYDPIEFACSSHLYTVCVWQFLLRRDFWNNLPFKFIEGYKYEDCEFSNKIVLIAGQITHVDFAFYYYRQRQGSSIYSASDKKSAISAIEVARSLNDFYRDHQFTPDEKICYSTLISPDILRAVSLRRVYRNNTNKLVENEIGDAFFHLKASKRFKHRFMYYLINLNVGLASSFLYLKYSLLKLKMQVKSLLFR